MMINASKPYFRYWGKAKPQDGSGTQFHLLPYHCLDVAAVGLEFCRKAPAFCRLLGQRLNFNDHVALQRWIVFWLAIHDLGKFSEAFQSQRPDLFKAMRGRPPDASKEYKLRHDSLGMQFWSKPLMDYVKKDVWFGPQTGLYECGLNYWARAVTGHHGQPPQEGGSWKANFHWQDDPYAILEFTTDIRALIFEDREAAIPTMLDPEAFELASQDLSWWMAGLAVLADWLGSNTDYFAYRADTENPLPLREYWEHARRQAVVALDHSGVLPLNVGRALAFDALFPSIITPSPLQAWAATAELSQGPQIYLLEDVTGAGKTEAAVLLAHRLMAAGHADGFFIGLPTMATANAMYGRIAQVYARLFEENASLVLAHGQRNLVEAFAESVIPAGPVDADKQQLDETASARCSAWLADHNKRALMAPAGVGTLDQALLAVLHSRHQSLRLLGLFRKVLVVDEVHACDTYMQGILENLLIFHARAGGSAILLSATLPQRMKKALLRAFARGCGCQRELSMMAGRTDYPLVTSWHSDRPDRPAEIPIATRDDVKRTVAVDYLSDEAQVIAAIETALAAGKCVCWIRNTVADALEACALFRGKLPADKLTLFHARFALRDRLHTERKVLTLFGKRSTPARRRGRLVIATQVVEQSLDADWDFVVSDLAPIDRLIQRAGRLQRHPRDQQGWRLQDPAARDQRGEPRLCVFGPGWTDVPKADWFKSAFRKAANVYSHHGQLWLTAKALQNGGFAMPGGARSLIEGVFGSDTEIPTALEHNANQAEGKAYGDASQAQQNTVKLELGYVRGGFDWWSEAKTPSRLGEASVNVVLARWETGQLVPWCAHANLRHAWAYSTVRVAERLIAKTAEPKDPERQAALEQALLTLPGRGQWAVLLPLELINEAWTGEAWSKKSGQEAFVLRRWQYQSESGLLGLEAPDEDSSGATPR
ncbi:MAG: CRISPR-associated helicase Cas3' [Candidatus Accumulibacter phosphatis]|nr:CRISPR-associated helicase Cas3' [Candidatus Accumulibacter contiguus]